MSLKRLRSNGNMKYYQCSNGQIIEVQFCNIPWLYENPGYYLTFNNDIHMNDKLLEKRFSSAKACANALYRHGGLRGIYHG